MGVRASQDVFLQDPWHLPAIAGIVVLVASSLLGLVGLVAS